MLTEAYIKALLVDEDLADRVWELWNARLIPDDVAAWAWCMLAASMWNNAGRTVYKAMNAGVMAMPEFRDDFWDELERLEAQRAEIQIEHDKALVNLFASRDQNDIAAPVTFDEYSARSNELSAAMAEITEFREKYTPYKQS